MTVNRRLKTPSHDREPEQESRPWTDAMIQFLLRMRRRGKPYGWIARALGRTRGDCVERAMRAGLLARRSSAPPAPVADEPVPLGPIKEVLGDGVCHWIADEEGRGEWRMCGHPGVNGSSWCEHHHARVYQPTIIAEMFSPNRWIMR